MHASTTTARRARAWFRLAAVGAVLGLAIGAMTVLPAKMAGAATGNTYYVNSATDTPFTTLADLAPDLCTSPTNTGCGIDDAIAFFNADTTANNADTIVFSTSVTAFTEGQPTAINNLTSGVTLAINGNGANQTTVFAGNIVPVLAVDSGVVNISGLTIADGNGGGIYKSTGTLTLIDSTVSSSSAGGDGGGIYNSTGTLTLIDSTVSGNTAGGNGGGIFNGGIVTLTDSTVSGNNSYIGSGGGIYNAGTVTLTDSTVSGNGAPMEGGGIYSSGTLTLTDSTLSGNGAEIGGGGISNGGTVNLGATIVAASTSGGDCSNQGTFTDKGYNIDGDGSCGFSGTAESNFSNLDASLGALANNGGPTLTILPTPTSPAVGAVPTGTSFCPRTDQRGVGSDPGFNCTIGAVEVLPTGTLSGHIYLCSNGTQTTTEVGGGTLAATGPQNVPSQANPLVTTTVEAGTYTVTATSPSGYQFSACGSTTNSASQQVVVAKNGTGSAAFYVAPISPCAAGLSAHKLTATYGHSTFTGLFCVNAKGVGTYTQGTVSGIGAVTTVKGTTTIGALGKNLLLVGATNGTKSGFIELAPVPSIGTFTLS